MDDETIKQTLKSYKDHLEKKCQDRGVRITDTNDGLNPAQLKLKTRYEAVHTTYAAINSKSTLDDNDRASVKGCFDTCVKSTPSWSERPFLQKLSDCLSLGMTLLYRSYTSKERQHIDQLEKQLNDARGYEIIPRSSQ